MSKSKQHLNSKPLTQRQRRVGEEVRHLLSECLMREDFHLGNFDTSSITVTEVRMSIDLKHAFAFVIPLGGKEMESALHILKEISPILRTYLSKKLRLRVAPILHFEPDKTFEEVERLEALLKSDHVAQDLTS